MDFRNIIGWNEMLEEITVAVSMIALVVSLLGIFSRFVGGQARIQERLKTVEGHIVAIEKYDQRISKLETQTDLFWKYVEKQIPKLFHSAAHPEKDVLLERFPNLSLKEMKELYCILEDELKHLHLKDTESKILAFAYSVTLARLEIIIQERDAHV